MRPGEAWDPSVLLSFYRNEKPVLPAEIIMAPVRAGNEVIGVLVLERGEGFERGAGKAATEMLKVAGAILGERRRRRRLEVACGAGGALARGVRPKDVIYRILHGARRLIDYDHGATVFARVDDCAAEIIAQQVAWAAGKGSLVGKRIDLDWSEVEGEMILAGEQGGKGWVETGGRCWSQDGDAAGADGIRGKDQGLAGLEGIWDVVRGVKEKGAPEKRSGLLVPLTSARGTIGLLEIASARSAFFRASDLDAARVLAPYLVLCLAGIDSSRGG